MEQIVAGRRDHPHVDHSVPVIIGIPVLLHEYSRYSQHLLPLPRGLHKTSIRTGFQGLPDKSAIPVHRDLGITVGADPAHSVGDRDVGTAVGALDADGGDIDIGIEIRIQ